MERCPIESAVCWIFVFLDLTMGSTYTPHVAYEGALVELSCHQSDGRELRDVQIGTPIVDWYDSHLPISATTDEQYYRQLQVYYSDPSELSQHMHTTHGPLIIHTVQLAHQAYYACTIGEEILTKVHLIVRVKLTGSSGSLASPSPLLSPGATHLLALTIHRTRPCALLACLDNNNHTLTVHHRSTYTDPVSNTCRQQGDVIVEAATAGYTRAVQCYARYHEQEPWTVVASLDLNIAILPEDTVQVQYEHQQSESFRFHCTVREHSPAGEHQQERYQYRWRLDGLNIDNNHKVLVIPRNHTHSHSSASGEPQGGGDGASSPGKEHTIQCQAYNSSGQSFWSPELIVSLDHRRTNVTSSEQYSLVLVAGGCSVLVVLLILGAALVVYFYLRTRRAEKQAQRSVCEWSCSDGRPPGSFDPYELDGMSASRDRVYEEIPEAVRRSSEYLDMTGKHGSRHASLASSTTSHHRTYSNVSSSLVTPKVINSDLLVEQIRAGGVAYVVMNPQPEPHHCACGTDNGKHLSLSDQTLSVSHSQQYRGNDLKRYTTHAPPLGGRERRGGGSCSGHSSHTGSSVFAFGAAECGNVRGSARGSGGGLSRCGASGTCGGSVAAGGSGYTRTGSRSRVLEYLDTSSTADDGYLTPVNQSLPSLVNIQ